MEASRYRSFAEFWPYYVSEHRVRACRALHYVGTTLALSNLVAAVVFRMPELLGAAVVSGYFFAWIGHFFIEKNRPATFTYPLWSLIADFKMFGLACAGRMAAEVSRVLDAEATGTSRPHS
ncbi:MAG: Mpo1-like protein [Nannocystaceae bacterium]